MSDEFAIGDLASSDPDQLARERAIRFRAASDNMAIQPPDYQPEPQGVPPDFAMGALAAQDQYRPLGNDPWTGLMRGQQDLPLEGAPFRDPNSPVAFKTASPLVNITQGDIENASQLGLMFSGGGLKIGDVLNPAGHFWHPVSRIKLAKPLEEYTSTRVPTPGVTVSQKMITPSDIEGSAILPTVTDPTATGYNLTHIEGQKLPEQVPLQGGPEFPAANAPVWAASQGAMSGLASKAGEIGEQTGRPVVVMPTALSAEGADYSHHIWHPLVDRLKDTTGISNEGRAAMNETMRAVDPAFPGVSASRDRLLEYFNNASRPARTMFVQAMDTRRMQDFGFPDVAAVRKAAIEPGMLHAPLGSSGFSMFKLDPQGIHASDIHRTYSHAGSGENVGSMGIIAPPEIALPDVMNSLRLMAQESGKPIGKYIGRPDYYFQGRIPAELPSGQPLARAQIATPQWVDTMSDYARRYRKVGGGAALAAGMTLAEIAKAQESRKMGGLAAQDQYNTP